MPSCVLAYSEDNSLYDAFAVQGEIVESYRMDFAKYTPQVDRHCLDAVFTAVSRSIGQQIKYAHLGEGFTNPTLKRPSNLSALPAPFAGSPLLIHQAYRSERLLRPGFSRPRCSISD